MHKSIHYFIFKQCLFVTVIVAIRKLHSTKSKRLEGVYWKFWWKFSICLYIIFFGLTKPTESTLNTYSMCFNLSVVVNNDIHCTHNLKLALKTENELAWKINLSAFIRSKLSVIYTMIRTISVQIYMYEHNI